MHPDWLSNAYVIADREGGTAVFVDSGADLGPLVAAVEEWGVAPAVDAPDARAPRPRRLTRTSSAARYGIAVVAEPGEWEWGGTRASAGSRRRATPTTWSPSSSATSSSSPATRSSRTQSAAATSSRCARSVMDVLHDAAGRDARPARPHGRDDDRPRARAQPVRARLDRARSRRERSASASADRDATLLVWSPDYDGKGKAWVRFDDGTRRDRRRLARRALSSRLSGRDSSLLACASSSPAAKSATPAA